MINCDKINLKLMVRYDGLKREENIVAIDRDTFEVGFLFGWYAGFVNYARVLKDNETLEWAQDNMCSL